MAIRKAFSILTLGGRPCSRWATPRRLVATVSDPHPSPAGAEQSLSYISYERKDEDKSCLSPLLLHHSLFGRKENWVKFGRALHHLTKRQVVIPDARNHGNSFSSKALNFKLMSGDLVKLLHQLNISRASLVGHGNLGGRVCMLTALTSPHLVDKMVVESATPLNTEALLKTYETYRQACYIYRTLSLSSNSSEDPVTFKLEADSALQETLPHSLTRANFINSINGTYQAVIDNPDLGRFPSLDGCSFERPVLFIRGDKSNTSWSSDVEIRKIRQLFPNSHFLQIPGGTHDLHIAKHDDLLESVLTFLQSQTGLQSDFQSD